MITEFAAGVRTLLRGFGFWKKRPGLMTLGLLPAVLAALLLLAALIPLALNLGAISTWMTPFAEGWLEGWRTALRVAAGIVVLVAALALAAAVFSALALVIGDAFYQRIWRTVEKDLGESAVEGGRFSTSVGEGVRLALTGLLVSALVLLLGLIPVIGGVVAAVTGFTLTGRTLARELMARTFDARDLDGTARSAVLRGGRSRTLGFGIATQLCFLIPLGAVLVMPAAVAGATMLARDLLDRAGAASASDASAGSPSAALGAVPPASLSPASAPLAQEPPANA